MRIFGPPTATLDTVTANARAKKASELFLSTIIPAVWQAALEHHVNPVGAVAQAAYETGWGKWPNSAVLTAAWRNVAGLKVYDPEAFGLTGETDYQKFAHQIFPSWRMGALAQVQHLVLYTGCSVDPDDLVDPRAALIAGKYLCETFSDLSGKWAGSPTYGASVERIASDLSRALA